jgi:phage terminase large subunit GpA-like protein
MSTQPNLNPEAGEALLAMCGRVRMLFAPPPTTSVTEWAEANRIIPDGASARPGPWVTESYQREIQDCITDPLVGRIVVMKSTQLGWSEIINNVIGYFIGADPKPQMLVQPRESDAKKYSRKRIAPMIEHCPSLKSRVREGKSRDGANTMLLKEYDGGFLSVGSANSAASLRSDPVAILQLDECDGYPLDVDGEGAPGDIAEHRTETFDDAKVLIGSTPAKPKGLSLIETEYNASSMGEYHVPCPSCAHMQPLVWRDPETGLYMLKFDRNEKGEVINESVRYICRACKFEIDERHKQRMLDAGRWVHKFPDRTDGRGLFIRGFRLNALYSPWRPIWASLAHKWVKAQDNPERLKTFINLSLGETFDEGGDSIEAHALAARRENFQQGAPIPNAACVLVATCDVQNNRVEIQHTAFGPGEESWLIDHHVVWGNPGHDDTWREVDEWLLQTYQHESGVMLFPSIVLIDSGDGGNTDNVYDYVVPRQNTRRRVFACKGVDYLSKPGLAAEGQTKKARVRLFTVATYAAKDRIFARLKIPKPGPGYIHLPHWVTDEYLEQLTAEKKVPFKNKKTRANHYVYVKTGPRNEALDLWVYAHAALFVLQNFADPKTYRDLTRLQGVVQAGQLPGGGSRARRVRSRGID